MYDEIRKAIVALVKTDFEVAYPQEQVAWDNSPFDYANPPAHYVEVEVRFYDGAQIGVSAAPRTRVRGYVYVTANIRHGLGNALPLQITDWFASQLAYRAVNGTGCAVQLQEPIPADPGQPSGWHSEQIKIPFHADPT